MENYWKLDGLELFSNAYAYLDHRSYLADNLLRQKKIRMRFAEEMKKEGSPYVLIFCKVRKADAALFEEAMELLKKKMLIVGHKDYEKACQDIAAIIGNCWLNESQRDSL